MTRGLGTFVFLGLVVLVPSALRAEPQDPCFAAQVSADLRIAACSTLLDGGTLSEKARVSAYDNRGFGYYSKGQYELAIADYSAALRIDPNHANSFNSRGVAYLDTGQYDLAIADFGAALNNDPNLADSHWGRASAYLAKDQNDLAIADFTQALRIDPGQGDSFFGRGNAYLKKSQYDDAVADFTVSLSINPSRVAAYRNRAHSYFVLGRFNESALDYKRATELQPKEMYLTLWLHISRLRSGSSDDDLSTRSASMDLSKWPAPILGLFLEKVTPQQFRFVAQVADRRCEASFYLAEWDLTHHETALARTGFSQAAEICPHTYYEYGAAAAELARLPK
jgi:lipoprotein NlpI